MKRGGIRDLIDQRRPTEGVQDLLARRRQRRAAQALQELASVTPDELIRILDRPRGLEDVVRAWRFACIDAGIDRCLAFGSQDRLRLKMIVTAAGDLKLAIRGVVEAVTRWDEFTRHVMRGRGFRSAPPSPEVWFVAANAELLFEWIESESCESEEAKAEEFSDPTSPWDSE